MNVFDLQAKIGLSTTEYKQGLKEASKSFSEFGGKVKDGAAKLAKISTAALGAAATGVSALVKQSVSAYADYEQLVGGIETLFGDSAKKVLANSEKAFATAGMSVNEYMETSIQGAASLINSLGGDTEKAAELMDVSIQDMADNVNKMGTNMEGVQNAYRGFSRGNFTMLDNLALGFAGTKEGMQELLDKAQELSGVEYDISSYADIVQAIHVVQEEMGITGTTAKEAAGTITGSMASVKAAWKNLTVEMAKADGDVGGAFQILGGNVGAVVENVIPRVEKALGGISQVIVTAAPEISKGISKALPKIIPSVMKSAGSIVAAVGQGVVQSLPDLLTAGKDMIGDIYGGFASTDFGMFNWLRDDAVKVADGIKDTFKDIDFKSLKGSAFNFGGSLNGTFERVGDAFVWLNDNVFSPLTTWAANDIIPDFLDAVGAGLDVIGSAVDFMKEPALEVWNSFLKPMSEIAGDVISGSLDLIAKGLGAVADELEGVDWSGYWEDIDNGEFFANWERGAKSISDFLSDSADDIDAFFNEGEFGRKWNEFWQGIGNSVYDQKELITSSITIITHYWNEFIDAWKTGKNEIVDAVDTIKNKYKEFQDMWGVGADEIKDTVTAPNSVGGIAYQIFKNKIPFFGTGGRVTQPTLAIVGEKEPETIVPDSKRGVFGNTTQNINVTINGAYNIENPDSRRSLIEEMSRELANLGINQKRAVGGVGW